MKQRIQVNLQLKIPMKISLKKSDKKQTSKVEPAWVFDISRHRSHLPELSLSGLGWEVCESDQLDGESGDSNQLQRVIW